MTETAIGRKWLAALVMGTASAAFLLAGAAPAFATTTVVIASGDTYVASANPTTNYGSNDLLRAGRNGDTPSNLRTYIKFPLPATSPGCATVVDQALEYGQPVSGDSSDAKWWAPAADGWAEDTLTWNNQPGFVSSAEVSGSPYSGADIAEAIQYLYDDGHLNRGIVLRSKATGDVNDVFVQASREGSAGAVPRLSLTYHEVC